MLAPFHFTRVKICVAGCGLALLMLAGCVVPPGHGGPSPEEIAKQQRVDRAQGSFNEALKQYDAGSYDDSLKNFLLALDSGLLNTAQQVTARKTLAFIHCLSNREPICKEEFEKAFALDAKFELSPAEAGHPIWGPVYRTVRTEIAFRKSGRPVPSAPAQSSAAELIIRDAMAEYDAAEYNKAIKLFQGVKDTATTAERVKALKFTAFSYCLSGRSTQCRAEFEKIFALQPDFDLEPAEAGHPSWGPSFRTVKAKQKPVKK